MSLAALTRRCLYCAALLVWSTTFSFAAGQAVGVVTSTGSFRVDGTAVSNSATIFEGNKVETGTVGCTLERTGGGRVEIDPNSATLITHSGIILSGGQARVLGGSELDIPGSGAAVKPGSAATIVRAQFVNNELIIDVLKGDASLTSKNSEGYARLDSGSRTRFPVDSSQPLGVDLLATGCLHVRQGHLYLKDEHIAHDIEVLGSTIEKEHSKVELRGAMQSLTPRRDVVAAVVQVVSEKALDGRCPDTFLPIWGDIITGAVGVSTIIPILQSPRVSVP